MSGLQGRVGQPDRPERFPVGVWRDGLAEQQVAQVLDDQAEQDRQQQRRAQYLADGEAVLRVDNPAA